MRFPLLTRRGQRHEADLARLADGSLPSTRVAASLRAELEQSPELAAELAEQRRVMMLLRGLDEPAPPRLRARVDEMTRTDAGRPVRSRSTAALVGATAVLAAAVAVVVLALPGSGQRPPSIAGTARLALVAPSAPAPAPAVDARDPYRLAVQASGIPFPNWAPRLVAAAAGHAAAGGRQVQTVLYRSPSGEQVGYAIVSGPPLAPVAGHRASYGGVSYTLARHGPLQIVTWTQHGHTCVIAATSVSAPALLGLAESEA